MEPKTDNKQGEGTAVVPQPEISLKTAETRPGFKAFEPVKIRLEANCGNVAIPPDGIEYHWKYSDSSGFEKSGVTRKSKVLLSCPNYFCGRVITVTVTVNMGNSVLAGTMRFGSSDLPMRGFSFIKDSVTLYPVCEKKLADKAEWFPEELETDSHAQATVEVSGFNGGEVGLRRYILDKRGVIWQAYDTLTVYDNSVSAGFSRNNCGIITEDETFTFRFQVVEAKTGNLLGDYSKDFNVKARRKVLKSNAFPLQPVVVGVVDIEENNFMPCKYTGINVEYPKGKDGKETATATVFKEGSPVRKKVNIIGGKRKATVKIEEYTPDKCKLDSPHSANKALLLTSGGEKQELPISVSGKTGKVEDIELSYKYSNIYRFLWLPGDICQTTSLLIATCRHTHKIAINLYPDIKWETCLKIEHSNPQVYSHSNMPVGYDIFDRHQKKAMEGSKRKPFKIGDLKISFGLAAEFNDGVTVDVSSEILSSIEKIAEVLKKIQDGIEMISFKKTVDENRGKIKARNILPKSSKIPVFLEISYPSLVLGGSWQFDTDPNNALVRVGGIAVAASPLIAAKGGIDLVACSTFIPVAGQIIKAILAANDVAERLVDIISKGKAGYESDIWFNLFLKGELAVEGAYEFSKGEHEGSIKAPVTIILGVELGLKAEISVKTVTIKGETTSTVKAGVSGEARTSIGFEPSMGYNSNEGMFLDFKVEFGGIEITVSGEAKYEKTENDKKKGIIGVSTEKKFLLVDGSTFWKGRLFPFRKQEQ